ncbi:pseudouridine synthase [Fictibacillus phosphorivorans]|uniref:pseudouridine synthase n=1 Tax=Fictibacillus phosphorivorans TaxID=1221500 RepID=UPI00203C67F6|nr:pseudouridine synthase [Fictibacillus phosphorivorans]MCM3718002.1 rRNA pseudouridine synthase [Fictibacillus phosphorivorans]MCM3775451.1 rRNA pseudouridine synthase [Fictibacillus phosphorivorans]
MRIDKWLSNTGFGSRKEVKQLLKSGAVKLNGTVIKDPKTQADPDKDQVVVHGEEAIYKEFIYLMMNKPDGVISATEDSRHETVIDLLELEDQSFEPFPVGRLDKDTEGLLILTNDGQLAHSLLSPKKHVPKTYFAKINGSIPEDTYEKFKQGVVLEDGYHTQPAKLEVITNGLEESEIYLTITEGKFHQVKRMFEAVERKVIYLKRVQMGSLKLDESLPLGTYRELTEEELSLLSERRNVFE